MVKKNEVLVFEEKGEFFTTSLDIADKFGKEHKNVLQSINEIDGIDEFWRLNFQPSEYISRGKIYPCFNITKDGCALLVMGFTGDEALQWKVKYIFAFNKLAKYVLAIKEQELKNRTEPERIELRKENKANNIDFNEAIDEFVKYAKQSGSGRSEMYFTNLNDMVNHAMFKFPKSLKKISDKLTPIQFIFINSMKQAIAQEIRLGISEGIYYKEIFKKCKARAELIASGLGVTPIPMLLEQAEIKQLEDK